MDERKTKFLAAHPEATEIFKLDQLMQEAGINHWFSYDDYSGADDDFFNEDYEYTIEIQTGELIGSMALITVFQRKDGLELLDMRPAAGKEFPTDSDGERHVGLCADEAMEIIEGFLK